MTFSNKVNEELTHININNNCCGKAELYGILKLSAKIIVVDGNFIINFTTRKAALSRRMLQFVKQYYNKVHTELLISRDKKLQKNNLYKVQFVPSDESTIIVKDFKLFSDNNDFLDSLISKRCCRRAFLRGIFLSAGNITNPNSSYHLEIAVPNKKIGENLIKVIHSFSIKARITESKNFYIVYINNSEGVVDFLNVIGAHDSLMKLENIQIVKETRNNVNRVVNCETANLNKVIIASVRQVKCIKYIDQRIGISQLNQTLQEAARIRLEHPEASLNELVDYFDGIGTSGINHRFKKLQKIAEGLGMDFSKI